MFIFMKKKKKSCLSLTSFLKYFKDIANFIFWVLLRYLATPTQSDSSNLYETLMFICEPKINLIPIFSRDIKL